MLVKFSLLAPGSRSIVLLSRQRTDGRVSVSDANTLSSRCVSDDCFLMLSLTSYPGGRGGTDVLAQEDPTSTCKTS